MVETIHRLGALILFLLVFFFDPAREMSDTFLIAPTSTSTEKKRAEMRGIYVVSACICWYLL